MIQPYDLQVTAALYKVKMPDAIRGMLRALQKYDQEDLNGVFADPVSLRDFPDYAEHIACPIPGQAGGVVHQNPERGGQLDVCDTEMTLFCQYCVPRAEQCAHRDTQHSLVYARCYAVQVLFVNPSGTLTHRTNLLFSVFCTV